MEGVWAGALAFADDIAIITEEAEEMNRALDIVSDFTNRKKMEINETKTVIMRKMARAERVTPI